MTDPPTTTGRLPRNMPIGFALNFHVRPNAMFPSCCEIWLADQFCARITAPAGTPIYEKAMALRASGGSAAECAYVVGVLDGLMAPRPQIMRRDGSRIG